ncbi:GntR family transcriptional regulator [Roseateles sp. BYS180W]|uniref:GntR family transcriptional regulator n=1 Tax=Roseateles rivi TaxID=3299028 RepID=A0ABW7FY89_9BURK
MPATRPPKSLPVSAAGLPESMAGEAAERGLAFAPLYRQVKARIVASLQSCEWRPGELIPSEMELAARLGVSQGTVRKAVDELAAENLLVRRQGRGTFVATHAEQRQQYRFLRLMADEGGVPLLERELLECRRLRAPGWVAKALQLRSGDGVIEIRRLLREVPGAEQERGAGTPVVLDDIWLPGALFKGLNTEMLMAHKGPFYGLLETRFGVQMIRAQERIRAVAADEETAALLLQPQGVPLLSVERLSYTYADKPVELRRGFYSTARHFYRNELN